MRISVLSCFLALSLLAGGKAWNFPLIKYIWHSDVDESGSHGDGNTPRLARGKLLDVPESQQKRIPGIGSLTQCSQLCKQRDGCKSVNHNLAEKKCDLLYVGYDDLSMVELSVALTANKEWVHMENDAALAMSVTGELGPDGQEKLQPLEIRCHTNNDCMHNGICTSPSSGEGSSDCSTSKCICEQGFMGDTCEATDPTYKWVDLGQTECSVTCGYGYQRERKKCVNTDNQMTVEDEYCGKLDDQVDMKPCYPQDCPEFSRWTTYELAEGSLNCGNVTLHRNRNCLNGGKVNQDAKCKGVTHQSKIERRPECNAPLSIDADSGILRMRSELWDEGKPICYDGFNLAALKTTCGQTRGRFDPAHSSYEKGPDAQKGEEFASTVHCDTDKSYQFLGYCNHKYGVCPSRKTVIPICAIDGQWGTWTSWSECDATCGDGAKQRSRSCDTPTPSNGGLDCSGDPTETMKCPAEDTPCPVNGVPTVWGSWTTCSKPCNVGERARTMQCTEAQHGGTPCAENTVSEACNEQDCPPDSYWAIWSDWGACSVSCGNGVEDRSRSCVQPEGGGIGECQPGTTKTESQTCNIKLCPAFVGDWGVWGACSVTCGGGLRNKTRVCQAVDGGEPCPELQESEECNTQTCDKDGSWATWEEWSSCSAPCEGEHIRNRDCVGREGNGATCPGSDTETGDCGIANCPVDCKWGAWSPPGPCSHACGLGLQTLTREKEPEEKYDGKACVGEPTKEEECQIIECPVDGKWSPWASWATCSKTCGSGTSTRTRTCSPPLYAGQPCEGESRETKLCNTDGCPRDCIMEQWGLWKECSVNCGGGQRERERGIIVESANGGKQCPSMVEDESCNDQPCPIDCILEEWNVWTTCSASCSGGTTYRQRAVKQAAAHGGVACESLDESKPCKTDPCPVDCKVTPWEMWGACSKPCGLGERSKTREIEKETAHGGTDCPPLKETGPCTAKQCPVDCQLKAWSAWGKCSKTCGIGSKPRTREIAVHPAYEGKPCGAQTANTACKDTECPVPCEVSDWSNWGECSVQCGTGTRQATRTETQQPLYNGAPCPSMTKTDECKLGDCPGTWEAWSKWSMCSQSCGETGTRGRSRECDKTKDGFKGPCVGDSTGNEDCNRFNCDMEFKNCKDAMEVMSGEEEMVELTLSYADVEEYFSYDDSIAYYLFDGVQNAKKRVKVHCNLLDGSMILAPAVYDDDNSKIDIPGAHDDLRIDANGISGIFEKLYILSYPPNADKYDVKVINFIIQIHFSKCRQSFRMSCNSVSINQFNTTNLEFNAHPRTLVLSGDRNATDLIDSQPVTFENMKRYFPTIGDHGLPYGAGLTPDVPMTTDETRRFLHGDKAKALVTPAIECPCHLDGSCRKFEFENVQYDTYCNCDGNIGETDGDGGTYTDRVRLPIQGVAPSQTAGLDNNAIITVSPLVCV